MEPLRQRLLQSGVTVDCVTSTGDARQQLWDRHYDSIAIDLLLADQDGISFALELRQEHPWASILVISTTGSDDRRTGAKADWLARTTDHARLVFALKQASQRSASAPPSILHVEDDDALASLVQNTIGRQTNLFRARSTQEARIAMALRTYDLALVGTSIPGLTSSAHDRNTGKPQALRVTAGSMDDPLLAILDNLRRSPFIHQAAYC